MASSSCEPKEKRRDTEWLRGTAIARHMQPFSFCRFSKLAGKTEK